MSAMADYLLEIEEEIKKWYPTVSWETIEDQVFKQSFVFWEAKKVIDKRRGYEWELEKRRGYEKNKRNHQDQ